MLNLHNKIRKQISYLLLPAMMMFTFSAFAPFSYGSVYHLDSLDHLDRFDKQKTVSENNKIEFYYNNGKIIDESDGTNISSYLIARHRILRSVNTINQQPSTNNQTQWLISNGKDVVATTDDSASGNGTALSNYTPYGEDVDFQPESLKNQSNIQNPTSNINANPFKYSGYYLDVESGLYYLNARFYSSELMRFINRDSYDLGNRYAYCDGNPISQTDPNGHKSWSTLDKVFFGLSFLPVVGLASSIIHGIIRNNKLEIVIGVCAQLVEAGIAWGGFRLYKAGFNKAERLIRDPAIATRSTLERQLRAADVYFERLEGLLGVQKEELSTRVERLLAEDVRKTAILAQQNELLAAGRSRIESLQASYRYADRLLMAGRSQVEALTRQLYNQHAIMIDLEESSQEEVFAARSALQRAGGRANVMQKVIQDLTARVDELKRQLSMFQQEPGIGTGIGTGSEGLE